MLRIDTPWSRGLIVNDVREGLWWDRFASCERWSVWWRGRLVVEVTRGV